MDPGEPEYRTQKPKARRKTPGVRLFMLALGWSMIVAAPIIGVLPGPGFLILFPVGLAVVLKNSRSAKRYYLKLRRRFPEYGRWTDWALRRKKGHGAPPFPPLKRDLLRLFRISRG